MVPNPIRLPSVLPRTGIGSVTGRWRWSEPTLASKCLDEARAGIFKPRAVEAVTEQQRRRYFQHQTEDDLWQVRATIKQLVEFKQHNLMQPLLATVFDCIFIRNVLIYFDQQSKQTVVKQLVECVGRRRLSGGGAVGGYLRNAPWFRENLATRLQKVDDTAGFRTARWRDE